MFAEILKAVGAVLLSAGIVYAAWRWLRAADDHDATRSVPPVTSGGATDGSDESPQPPRKARPKAK